MAETQEFIMSDEVWSANDYSNIITISSAAIASVLLVVFKSRCSNISLCCGLFSCDREVIEEDKEKEKAKVKGKVKKPLSKKVEELVLELPDEEEEEELVTPQAL